MKKILLSLGMIVFTGAIVIGATGAFYNDTETSNGNVFVAGSIDLKVDHTKQTYNGVDCETCSVDVYSSTATEVVAASAGAAFPAVPRNADDVSSPHPGWQNEAALAPAQWIWASDPTSVTDTTNDVEYTFQNKFQWNGAIAGVDLDLALASDNGYKIILNGTTIVDKLSSEFTYGSAVSLTGPQETAFIGEVVNGQNTLQIIVRNKALAADPVTGNPAGLLFNLNISRPIEDCVADSEFQQACRLWSDKDLGEGDVFFSFGDIKPGDFGTNVISLHVDSNEAYTCLLPINQEDLENICGEAEVEDGDTSCTTSNGDGELGTQINVVVWNDSDNQDGVHQPGEEILGQGSIKDFLAGEFTLPGGQTEYLGLAWCAGSIPTMTDSDGPVTCDASGMNNQAQSDSFLADLELYVTQTRNNSEFSCEDIVPIED